MHLNLTTSKRISLVFTLYSIGIVLLFGITINVVFFRQWYAAENTKLFLPDRGMPIVVEHGGRFARPLIDIIPHDDETLDLLHRSTVFLNLAHIDSEYILYKADKSTNTIRVSIVSRLVEAQRRLINTFLLLAIILSFLTYRLSLFIVKKYLNNINTLVRYVKNLDLHSIEKPVPVSGPADDEIRTIGETLQSSLAIIKQQTDSLKDFVTYTSHELKTPLMSLNATIDVWLKKWTHAETLEQAKKAIYHINSLFDTLLSITKREYQKVEKKEIDIVPLIEELITMAVHICSDKHITIEKQLPSSYILLCNEDSLRTIIYNLLQNAYKYTPTHGKITIILHEHILSITDTGTGISDEDKEHIRKKFRKNHTHSDHKEWFGLWLYLVSLLTSKHWWHIDAKDNTPSWTAFTLHFSPSP